MRVSEVLQRIVTGTVRGKAIIEISRFAIAPPHSMAMRPPTVRSPWLCDFPSMPFEYQDVTKNVNKNNVTHAVLFEAINLVIHLGRTTDLLPQACGLLGRFISIREANIRYLGLETMARLSVAQPDTVRGLSLLWLHH